MRTSKFLLIALFFLLISACKEPLVVFEQPQPAHRKDLADFPKRLQGTYGNGQENSSLHITQRMIVLQTQHTDTLHINELDSKREQIQGDQLVHLHNKALRYPIVRIGDSLFTNYRLVDTLFAISPEAVLRKWKGRYFLNTKIGVSGWNVEQLTLQKGILRFAAISSEEQLQLLEPLNQQDSVPYFTTNPSKKDFQNFLRAKGFETKFTYIKIKD